MKYQVLNQGFIYRSGARCATEAAVTSRCAITRRGELLCSFLTQTALSRNDFIPTLAVSNDHGVTWKIRGPVFPHLTEKYSLTMSISRAPGGDLFLFGARTPRNKPGESFWCQETLGILPNELVWSRSQDDGNTWSDPQAFPLPLPGSAECPAPLCVLSNGRWLGPYAPHNTFDPNLKVDLKHIVLLISDDEGKHWRHRSMIHVHEQDAYVAESWVTELSDGRLLGTAWHLRRTEGDDYPNVFAVSHDRGDVWSPTCSTPILGQSAGIAPLPDGKVLFAYNQRRHGVPGVWLAVAKPTDRDFGLIHNDIVWHAAVPTQSGSSGKSLNWTDFAFGEPSVTVLPDNTVLVAFWCIQPDGSGVGFVKLRID